VANGARAAIEEGIDMRAKRHADSQRRFLGRARAGTTAAESFSSTRAESKAAGASLGRDIGHNVTAGDIALLQCLVAAGLVGDDLWQRHCELVVGTERIGARPARSLRH
jgi:hypothetical protein